MSKGNFGEIAVIGDNSMVTGFRLAGVTKFFELEGEDAEKKLAELLKDENINIIIVSEKVLYKANSRLRSKIESIAKPIVVPVPDRSGAVEEEESASLREMVKRALGFDLYKGGGS